MSTADEIAAALRPPTSPAAGAPPPVPTRSPLVPGDVVAVSGGTFSVKISGAPTAATGVYAVASASGAGVGDRVWLLPVGTIDGPVWLIVGLAASPTWITPALNANWGGGGGSGPIQYCKDALGFVHMRGWAQVLAGATNPIFTLPAGYFPATYWATFPVIGGPAGTNNLRVIQVIGGAVNGVSLATNDWISVDPVYYWPL